MRILGIDPGTAATGFGVIAVEEGRLRAVEAGVITTPAGAALELRLSAIFGRVSELIAEHAPAAVALEDLYVGGNPRTVLSVGHARGAVFAACGLAGVAASGYPPAEVKQTVCGFGRAEKAQVARMVAAVLRLAHAPASDHETDALAVAVCHAQRSRTAPMAAAGGRA